MKLQKAQMIDNGRALGFAECSYYNGSKPANLTPGSRFQLRTARPGGNGWELRGRSNSLKELCRLAQRTVHGLVNVTIFEVAQHHGAA